MAALLLAGWATVPAAAPKEEPDMERASSLVAMPETDLAIDQSHDPQVVLIGGIMDLLIEVWNSGPTTASNVVVTDVLPSHLHFLGWSSDRASCTNLDGRLRCELGAMPEGDFVTIHLMALGLSTGLGTNRVEVDSDTIDFFPDDNVSDLGIPVVFEPLTFRNTAPIHLPDNGPANTYPSTIEVSGLTNAPYKITVLLSNMSHTFPDDLDILLVGPGGELAMVMSDAGGPNQLVDTSIILDDDVPEPLPDSGQIFSGRRYQPRNHNIILDSVPPPAPGGPYGSRLDAFRGINPNGVWSLYVVDDVEFDAGAIQGGWAMEMVPMNPFTDLQLSMTSELDRVGLGSNIVYSISVSNAGPSVATTVILTNLLPDEVGFVSATPSQGTCILSGPYLECGLEVLGVGEAWTLRLEVRANVPGVVLNTAWVRADQLDLLPANSTDGVSIQVTPLIDLNLASEPLSSSGWVGDTQSISLIVTNQSVNAATGVLLTGSWPGSILLQSAVPTQGSCNQNQGTLTCTLGTLGPGAVAVVVATFRLLEPDVAEVPWLVQSDQVDRDFEDNGVESALTVLPVAGLGLSERVFPSPALVIDEVSLLYRVINSGPNPASAVVVSSRVPLNAAIRSIAPSHGTCTNDNQGLITCHVALLPANDSATIEIILEPAVPGLLTNRVEVTAAEADRDLGNNAVETVVVVKPVADLGLSTTSLSPTLPVGVTLQYGMVVTNKGPNVASSVTFSNRLAPELRLGGIVPSQGQCSEAAGLVTCALGALAPGAAATLTMQVQTVQPGLLVNTLAVSAPEQDVLPADNQVTQYAQVLLAHPPISQPGPIMIVEQGPATVYPSTLMVSGLPGAQFRVSVTLSNLYHSFPRDMDILLVGPGGGSVMLLSDVGGGLAVSNVTLTLSDAAPAFLPENGPLINGRFRPTNGVTDNEQLPPPAPEGPHASALQVLGDTDPNGLWSLFVFDNVAPDSGGLLGGWGLQFETLLPSADLALVQSATPQPVAIASNVTVTLTLTNRGPDTARDVVLTNRLPAGVSLSEVVTTHGGCTVNGALVSCALAILPAQQAATVRLTLAGAQTGTFTNHAEVMAYNHDPAPVDNVSALPLEVQAPPGILSSPVSRSVSAHSDVTFTVSATGSPPLMYQWQFNGADLPGASGPQLILNNVQAAQAGAYWVRVTNRVGGVLSGIAQLEVTDLQSIEPVILQDGPLHYYRLEEAGPTEAAADQGNPGGRPGTYNGGVTLGHDTLPMALGRAARFDGAPGTYVDLGLFHPGDAITVEAWVWMDVDARTNALHSIVARWDGSFELGVSTDDRPHLLARNQDFTFGRVAAASPIARGQWQHLVGVYDNQTLLFYVNGAPAGSQPLSGVLHDDGPSPDRVLIGATRDGSNVSFNWKGWIDEVAVYGGALAPERVQAHYLAGLPPLELTLTADRQICWPATPSDLELQFSTRLGTGAAWETDNSLRTLEEGYYKVTPSMAETSRFYRLYKP